MVKVLSPQGPIGSGVRTVFTYRAGWRSKQSTIILVSNTPCNGLSHVGSRAWERPHSLMYILRRDLIILVQSSDTELLTVCHLWTIYTTFVPMDPLFDFQPMPDQRLVVVWPFLAIALILVVQLSQRTSPRPFLWTRLTSQSKSVNILYPFLWSLPSFTLTIHLGQIGIYCTFWSHSCSSKTLAPFC